MLPARYDDDDDDADDDDCYILTDDSCLYHLNYNSNILINN